MNLNDLPAQLKFCHILMYADDTVIYFSDKTVNAVEQSINAEDDTVN